MRSILDLDKLKNDKRGRGWGFLAFLFIIALAGFLIWAYYKNIDFGELLGFKTPGNYTYNFTNPSNITCLECQDFPDVNMMAYYFDNDTTRGFNMFVENSERYLYCNFVKLESDEYSSKLLALKNKGVDVKVNFGIEETMSSCDVTCIPKMDSEYDFLLGEGVKVSYSRTNFNYCVNERAIYIFSLSSDGVQRQENGLIIFNPEIRRIYYDYFNKTA